MKNMHSAHAGLFASVVVRLGGFFAPSLAVVKEAKLVKYLPGVPFSWALQPFYFFSSDITAHIDEHVLQLLVVGRFS